MQRVDYDFATLKMDVREVMADLIADRKHPQYKIWLQEHAGHNPGQISGPHAKDRNALYWPFVACAMSCNRHGTLHGGVAAKLLDTFTSMHYVAATGNFRNVTVNLNLTYLRAMPKGAKGTVVTYVQKSGKRLIMLEGRIVDSDDHGITYVSCTHTKAVLPSTDPKSKL